MTKAPIPHVPLPGGMDNEMCVSCRRPVRDPDQHHVSVYRCFECGRIATDWEDWVRHNRHEDAKAEKAAARRRR